MPAPYSLDLRKKAVSAYENGEGTQEEISTRFSVGLRTFQEWLVLKNMTGNLEPKEHIYRGKKSIIDEKGLAFIRKRRSNHILTSITEYPILHASA